MRLAGARLLSSACTGMQARGLVQTATSAAQLAQQHVDWMMGPATCHTGRIRRSRIQLELVGCRSQLRLPAATPFHHNHGSKHTNNLRLSAVCHELETGP